MQPCDGKCECSKASDSDGRRDAEQATDTGANRVASEEVTHPADRSVCLSAGLTGNGGLAL